MRKVAVNRRATFDYEVLETIDAGLLLKGTEVKSLRFSNGDISNSYCVVEGRSLVLGGFSVQQYKNAVALDNHDPKRPKKLLVRKKELFKLISFLDAKGGTIIPLEVFFSDRGWVKVRLAMAKGKKKYDKRRDIKDKEWARRKQQLM